MIKWQRKLVSSTVQECVQRKGELTAPKGTYESQNPLELNVAVKWVSKKFGYIEMHAKIRTIESVSRHCYCSVPHMFNVLKSKYQSVVMMHIHWWNIKIEMRWGEECQFGSHQTIKLTNKKTHRKIISSTIQPRTELIIRYRFLGKIINKCKW